MLFFLHHSFVIAGAKIGIFCVYASILEKKNTKKKNLFPNPLNVREKVMGFFYIFFT
jgi:hypothetical protein